MAARPPPPLPDELVEAILLRIPPDDPVSLMRAAIACKHWCRLVSGPAFRRGFLRVHQTPPVLGVLHNIEVGGIRAAVRFFPTCSFFRTHGIYSGSCRAIDSRHGRVLLRSLWSRSWDGYSYQFSIWNPITDEHRQLPLLRWFPSSCSTSSPNFNAAGLCAGAGGGCDHLDCHGRGGRFLVIFVATLNKKMFSYVYSSEANAWSESTSAPCLGKFCKLARGALVENSLYFVLKNTPSILKYDLGTREVTVIDVPPVLNPRFVLTIAVAGRLRCVTVEGSEFNDRGKLCLWSREVGLNGDIRWAPGSSINLRTLMPIGRSIRALNVVGFVDGGGVVFVGTDRGTFATNLKSGCFKQINWECGFNNDIVPYMSFYTPALQLRVASTNDGPRASDAPALSGEVNKNVGASFCEMSSEVLSDEAMATMKKPVQTRLKEHGRTRMLGTRLTLTKRIIIIKIISHKRVKKLNG